MTRGMADMLPMLIDRVPQLAIAHGPTALSLLIDECLHLLEMVNTTPIVVYPSYSMINATDNDNVYIGDGHQLIEFDAAIDYVICDCSSSTLATIDNGTGQFVPIKPSMIVAGRQFRIQIVVGDSIRLSPMSIGCFDSTISILELCIQLASKLMPDELLTNAIETVWTTVGSRLIGCNRGERRLRLVQLLSTICSLIDVDINVDFASIVNVYLDAHRSIYSASSTDIISSPQQFGLKTKSSRIYASFLASLQTMADRCGRQSQLMSTVFPLADDRQRIVDNFNHVLNIVGTIRTAIDNSDDNIIKS
jgi:hypothetical protein